MNFTVSGYFARSMSDWEYEMSPFASFRLTPVLLLLTALPCLAQRTETRPAAKLDTKAVQKLLEAGDELVDEKDYGAALLKYKDAYEHLVADFRGLPFKHPVKPRLMDRSDLKEYMLKRVSEELSNEDFHLMRQTYVAFGLVPDSIQLKEMLADLYTEEIAGFYDSEKKDLVLINEKPQPKQKKKGLFSRFFASEPEFDKNEQKTVLAHEMTHALQDQHFDLTLLDKAVEHDDDMIMALTSLIEGEACVVMFGEQERDGGNPRAMLKMAPQVMDVTFIAMQMVLPFAGGKTFRAAPRILRDSLIFPYHKGSVFVLHLTNRGGWKPVNEAFRDPPVSTEQILHPAKYIGDDRDHPVEIELPDLAKACGDAWKELGQNVMGEYQMAVLLGEAPGFSKAAAGWDGDKYVIAENSDGAAAFAWVSTWDTPEDAREFAAAYVERLHARAKKNDAEKPENPFHVKRSADQTPATEKDSADAPQSFRHDRDGGIEHVERRGADLVIVKGFDNKVTGRLLPLLFAAKKSQKIFKLPQVLKKNETK